jgi:hypothetical protein
MEGVSELGDEENIWTEQGGYLRKMRKLLG